MYFLLTLAMGAFLITVTIGLACAIIESITGKTIVLNPKATARDEYLIHSNEYGVHSIRYIKGEFPVQPEQHVLCYWALTQYYYSIYVSRNCYRTGNCVDIVYEDTIGFCVTPYKYEKFDPDEKINLVKNHDIIKTIHILAFALNEGEVVVREYQFEIDFNNDFDSTYNDLALMDRNIFKEFAKRVPYLSYNEYCKAKSQYNVE